MVLLLNGPVWFRGIDTIFTFVFALVTLLVAILSYKAYTLTEQQRHKYFSLSFFLLFLSFLISGIVSTALITHISQELYDVLFTFDVAFLIVIALATFAYMTLTIITLNVKEKVQMALMLTVAAVLVLFSYQHYLKFHIVSLVLLFFLAYQFYLTYQKKGHYNTKLIFTSFYFLAAAELFTIVSVYTSGVFYVLAQVVQVLGYLLLFYMLLRVLQHGSEKRKA